MTVTLDTPRALYEHEHQIAAYCPRCERWRELGLLDFVRAGKAEQKATMLSLRCCKCGEKGEIQIRPPCPRIERYGPDPLGLESSNGEIHVP